MKKSLIASGKRAIRCCTKALKSIMVKRGERSDEESSARLPRTKKVKTVTNSEAPAGLEELNRIRLSENEELQRKAQGVTDTVKELRRGQDSYLDQKKDQEIHDLKLGIQSLSDAAAKDNENLVEARRRVASCQFQINARDEKIWALEKSALEAVQVREDLEIRIEKMQQQLCKELDGCGSYVDGSATPFLLESTMKALQTSTSSFTKLFVKHCESCSVDPNPALRTHFENTYLTRTGHVTYMHKAWIFDIIFRDFENESYKRGGTSIFLDDTERSMKSFECFQFLNTADSSFDHCGNGLFQDFCHQKLQEFLSLWQASDQVTAGSLFCKKLEDAEVGELPALLMESFKAVAKGAWILHKLSLSFQPRAEVFRVNKAAKVDAGYMETVVSVLDDERFISEVGFMICPGFRLRKSVLKSQIYLAGTPRHPQ